MRNLRLDYCIKYETEAEAVEYNSLVQNYNNNEILYLYTKNIISSYSKKENSLKELSVLSGIVDCEYLMLSNELCVALDSGEIFLINIESNKPEVVSYCENGIEAMKWSPDQEVVVFITKKALLVIMSSAFTSINETFLSDTTNLGPNAFVSVGWGSKETQFHGSEGKQAAKEQGNNENLMPNNINILQHKTEISWRGDCELFAVSFSYESKRLFKIYNKEGNIQFISEDLCNLGPVLAWRPSGNWIAVPHLLSNKYTIGLFEKNGLRHREVVLPFTIETELVINISWSSDSDILLIETEKSNKNSIYIYMINNYHWYLKYQMNFEQKIKNLCWDMETSDGKKLYILLDNGVIYECSWNFDIICATIQSTANQAIVAVTDGNKLLLTDFRNTVIPPPMSGLVIERSTNIQDVGFINNAQEDLNICNDFFIYDSNGCVAFYKPIFEEKYNRHKLVDVKCCGNYKILVKDHKTSVLNNFTWVCSDKILFCSQFFNSTILYIGLVNITEENIEIVKSFVIKGYIARILPTSLGSIVLHFTNGKFKTMNLNDEHLDENSILFDLHEYCDTVKSTEINGTIKIISLKTNRNLYINDDKIDTDVTSFFIHENCLVLTYLNCMKFMLWESNTIAAERRIERGGKIIVIIPKDLKIILQMPRGNLEIIEPRFLLIYVIGKYLDNCEYGLAIKIMRKQRINQNIIIDHNPNKFFDSLDKFFEDIQNPEWLNNILIEISNEDVTQTMYSSNYKKFTTEFPYGYEIKDKINFVCNKMCEYMKKKDFHKYILPIITSYVKQGNLEGALSLIWLVKQKEMENSKELNQNKSEESIRHLLYLVNVNDLYNIALGMYNFDIVMFVATKSQKDPKEYIPFLNQLQKLEINYRKYKIDEYLKRYQNALEHITKCINDHSVECLNFIVEHKLYSKALLIFENDIKYYEKIALLFADYLRSKGKLNNASLMYERGGDINQAIATAKNMLDWERIILLSRKRNDSDENLKSIIISLVPGLEENGRYEDAAYLLKHYCQDLTGCIQSLLKGHLYLKAYYVAKSNSKEHLIDGLLKVELLSYCKILMDNICSDGEQFKKYKSRLENIRNAKLESKDEQLMNTGIDECDLFSDTTSVNSSKYTSSSRSTNKTFRSSKNRRKHERKLLSLKEGNPFEDVALIDAIYNLVQKIFEQQKHIQNIIKVLLEIQNDRLAMNIQKEYATLLSTINNSLDEIWNQDVQNSGQITAPSQEYLEAQHYAALKPQQKFKPLLQLIEWEQEILK